ncbi:MAG: hypothetical protein AB1Z65_18910 [Candidatus Sulfomarinibacteraceae bacterium]
MSRSESRAASPAMLIRNIHRTRLRTMAVLATALLVVAPGCATTGNQKATGPKGKELKITPAELQVKVRALADPFSGIVEETVWKIWSTTDSAEDRRDLLVWQINLVNSIQRATFQPVPLAALFDTWALVEQLRDFAESSTRTRLDAEQGAILLGAVEQMEAAIMKIAVEAGGEEGAATAYRLIREWADDHPIDQFVSRSSTDSELAHWTARGNMSALATVKSLGASLDDVMARLDLYSEYIPKQASWHAQSIAYDWIAPGHAEGAFADLSTTASAFDRIATSLEGYPEAVSQERRIVLETVVAEREQILEELMQKFADLQLFINAERVDLVENQLRTEREAIFEAIAAERAVIIAEARKERVAAMDDLDEMVDGIVERSAVKIVDHFFLRAAQLLAIGLVGLAVIAVAVVMLWKRK